jgi:glycosyltransferase involved in cell wall biosynthesis
MGGAMPPRVSYWTGTWEPRFEAHSQEIELLRSQLGRGFVVSAASGQRAGWSPRQRVARLAARNVLALRALARWIEPRADVSHLFGAMDGWHLLRSVGRRPVLFTVTIAGRPAAATLYSKVTRFAAETDRLAALLLEHGADPERVEVVPPGVDLRRFAYSPPPSAPPVRVLFASSPPTPELFEERGVALLVELARARPDVAVTLLWRPWGDRDRCRRALSALDPPPNLHVIEGCRDDLPRLYRDAHLVACLFAGERAKSAPNSLVEGLACGRPALVTGACGLAAAVAHHRAGLVVEPRVDDLAAAIDVVRSRLPELSRAARRLAEDRFDAARFVARYESLYEELAAPRGVEARRKTSRPA